MELLLLWLGFTVLGGLKALAITLIVIILSCVLIALFIQWSSFEETDILGSLFKFVSKKILFATLGISIFFTIIIPSESQLKYIIGGYVAYSFTQGEGAEKLPKNIIKAMNDYLEEINNDTTTSTK